MDSEDIRKKVIDLVIEQQDGHIGGSLSCVEIVVALYDKVLKSNDKFIMSKGHSCYTLYVVLREKGFNPIIAGHPDIDIKNGIECTIGSLGHGLPVAVGMALAKKLKNESGKIYVLLGDGECQEGTTWESLMIASHHNLDNLCVIIDKNKFQALDRTTQILSLETLVDKLGAFGCFVDIVDGHNENDLCCALEKDVYQPKVIIAETVKGKGLKIMENKASWHARIPNQEEVEQIYKELK